MKYLKLQTNSFAPKKNINTARTVSIVCVGTCGKGCELNDSTYIRVIRCHSWNHYFLDPGFCFFFSSQLILHRQFCLPEDKEVEVEVEGLHYY